MLFRFKFNSVIKLLRNNRLDEACNSLLQLIKLYPNIPELYISLAKVYFRKGLFQECKNYLLKTTTLPKWYTKNNVTEILELTNWKMLFPNRYFCREPSFSFDGNKIVFIAATEDTNNDGKINISDCAGVYIINRDGTGVECVVPNKYYNSSAVFSYDGRYICFLSAREDTDGNGIIDNFDQQGLYLLDLTTGKEKLLIPARYRPKHPSFSLDSKKIIFTCWQSPTAYSGVYEIEIDSLTTRRLVEDKYENAFPSYSPDGSKILYVSWRTDYSLGVVGKGSGVYIKDIITGEEFNVAPSYYINSFPVFSPDGKKVAYLSKRRDTNNDGIINTLDNDGIYLYDLRSKKEKCVHSDNYYNKFINFTADGKYIVFLSTWHRKKDKDIVRRDYFEFKGIYCCNLNGKELKQIVSDKYYGCASPKVSPKFNEVVYTSFRKDTLRGLYLANIDRLPFETEIVDIIKKNL